MGFCTSLFGLVGIPLCSVHPSVWGRCLVAGASLANVVWSLVLGLGVVGSVSLFLTSFGLMKGEKMAVEWGMKISFMAGIALVALTAGSVWVWYALLGFVLATLGSIVASM